MYMYGRCRPNAYKSFDILILLTVFSSSSRNIKKKRIKFMEIGNVTSNNILAFNPKNVSKYLDTSSF